MGFLGMGTGAERQEVEVWGWGLKLPLSEHAMVRAVFGGSNVGVARSEPPEAM